MWLSFSINNFLNKGVASAGRHLPASAAEAATSALKSEFWYKRNSVYTQAKA